MERGGGDWVPTRRPGPSGGHGRRRRTSARLARSAAGRFALATALLTVVVLTVGAPAAMAAFPGTDGAVVVAGTGGLGYGGGHGSGRGLDGEFSSPCAGPGGGSALFALQPGSNHATVLTCTPGTDSHPFVSPDGSEVVFTNTRGHSPSQLFTIALGSSGHHVTPTLVSDSPTVGDDDASWSPTGDGTIVFQRTLPGDPPQLYTENVSDPASAVPVFSSPTGTSDTEPVFDPSNAQLVVFVRLVGGHSHIFSYDLADQTLTDLSAQGNGGSSADDSKPDFSPWSGGGRIVFESDRACGSLQLYTMTPQGTDQQPVFRASDNGAFEGAQVCRPPTRDPVYSPDGESLAFDQSAPWSLDSWGPFEVPVDAAGAATGHVTSMTTFPGGFRGFSFPIFSAFDDPSWGPAGSPPAQAPEAALPVLLPIAGVVTAGTLLVVRRRKRQVADA